MSWWSKNPRLEYVMLNHNVNFICIDCRKAARAPKYFLPFSIPRCPKCKQGMIILRNSKVPKKKDTKRWKQLEAEFILQQREKNRLDRLRMFKDIGITL